MICECGHQSAAHHLGKPTACVECRCDEYRPTHAYPNANANAKATAVVDALDISDST